MIGSSMEKIENYLYNCDDLNFLNKYTDKFIKFM